MSKSPLGATSIGPGSLCTIAFTNIVGGTARTEGISFAGSKVDYESVGIRSLSISPVSVDLL